MKKYTKVLLVGMLTLMLMLSLTSCTSKGDNTYTLKGSIVTYKGSSSATPDGGDDSQLAIKGHKVWLDGGSQTLFYPTESTNGIMPDTSGTYTFRGVPKGTYTLTAEGYNVAQTDSELPSTALVAKSSKELVLTGQDQEVFFNIDLVWLNDAAYKSKLDFSVDFLDDFIDKIEIEIPGQTTISVSADSNGDDTDGYNETNCTFQGV